MANAPLISVDFIIQNPHGKFLLGKRINRPAKGFYFVPGGRVFKNEKLSDAITRIADTELGLKKVDPDFSSFKGVYEHFYEDSFLDKSMSTHYVVLAFSFELESFEYVSDQHCEFQWLSPSEILKSSKVHEYTKNYFHSDSN